MEILCRVNPIGRQDVHIIESTVLQDAAGDQLRPRGHGPVELARPTIADKVIGVAEQQHMAPGQTCPDISRVRCAGDTGCVDNPNLERCRVREGDLCGPVVAAVVGHDDLEERGVTLGGERIELLSDPPLSIAGRDDHAGREDLFAVLPGPCRVCL